MLLTEKEVQFINDRIDNLQYLASTSEYSVASEYLDVIAELLLVLNHDQALLDNEIWESRKYEKWEVK